MTTFNVTQATHNSRLHTPPRHPPHQPHPKSTPSLWGQVVEGEVSAQRYRPATASVFPRLKHRKQLQMKPDKRQKKFDSLTKASSVCLPRPHPPHPPRPHHLPRTRPSRTWGSPTQTFPEKMTAGPPRRKDSGCSRRAPATAPAAGPGAAGAAVVTVAAVAARFASSGPTPIHGGASKAPCRHSSGEKGWVGVWPKEFKGRKNAILRRLLAIYPEGWLSGPAAMDRADISPLVEE
ncbi:hypothetical protein B0T20DRAFT_466485 [Sordaria brevicollis]|uniref:Uncharacterized protein n=1 Tax=Sordaria brevicollis TaxID=83679 RepID=A0AAE0PKE3_SORBR|nr:hypothetical protein B0T20DRAFT_466485 [Sordaria brevicollis]